VKSSIKTFLHLRNVLLCSTDISTVEKTLPYERVICTEESSAHKSLLCGTLSYREESSTISWKAVPPGKAFRKEESFVRKTLLFGGVFRVDVFSRRRSLLFRSLFPVEVPTKTFAGRRPRRAAAAPQSATLQHVSPYVDFSNTISLT